MNTSPSTTISRLSRWGSGLFWLWNLVFLCSSLPLIPAMPSVLMDWWSGNVPGDYAWLFVLWFGLPWAALALAILRLRQRPDALAFLLFAIEGPLFSFCLYRLIMLRELTPAVWQWLLMAAFGLTVHGIEVVIRPLPAQRIWRMAVLVMHTGLLLFAMWMAALIILAWTPLLISGLWAIINPLHWGDFLRALLRPEMLLFLPICGSVLLVLAGSLVAMPICLGLIALRAFRSAWQAPALTRKARWATVLVALLAHGLLFVWFNTQPQRNAFALLESPTLTPAQFAEKREAIRLGLVNAYLAEYRYVSSRSESNGVQSWYADLLDLPEAWAAIPQQAFNALATPLLYDGKGRSDEAYRAAELYEQYFDQSIQRGERKAITRALSATYQREERESGLININQRRVRIVEQRAQATVLNGTGDLARVTLDETYENLTTDPQEIFYLFSLPESAAITGLWLGNAPDNLLPATIATRGAAQQVYKAEVQRRVDPALLEQVGPRQYRLRAFPVPGKSPDATRRADADASPVRLYLRLEYVTPARDKAWPLPVLAEKRNVGWDRTTRRLCGGTTCRVAENDWWPQALATPAAGMASEHAYTVENTGASATASSAIAVVARPASASLPTLRARKIALVVDRSDSMNAHRTELLATLRNAKRLLAGNTVTLLLTTTPVMQQPPTRMTLDEFSDDQLGVLMGGGSVNDMLQQASNSSQDLTVLLTDTGAFNLERKHQLPVQMGGMLSIVHLGGILAPVYDDATLAAIQTRGGSSFATLDEAWQHYLLKATRSPDFLMRRDGYDYWLDHQPAAREDIAFAPLAAHLHIANAIRQTTPPTVEQLDQLHGLAQKARVVTPYSSMLVLVDARQEDALAKEEQQRDRFERETERGDEILTKPSNPFSASMTPEPEEWLLLIVSLLAAGTMWWRQRFKMPAAISMLLAPSACSRFNRFRADRNHALW